MEILKTNTQTITLDGTEQEVRFNRNYPYFWVQNQGSSDVLMSTDSGITYGKDGVMTVLSGGTACTMHGYDLDRFYLMGTGKVQVVGTYSAHCPFKSAQGGGDYTASGAASYSLANAVDYPLLGLSLFGKSTQDGTPTPENPVEIVSVGDDGAVEITTCGKNLFTWNDYTEAPFTAWGHTSINKSNDVINYTATESAASSGTYIAHNDFIKYFTALLNVKSFTLSCEMRADIDNVTVAFGMQRSTMATCNVNLDWKKYICTSSYTDDSECKPVWSMRNLAQTATLYIRNIQIEIGDTATDYEPYKGSTASITTALPLCSVDDVCDELIYNADGTGKIIKRTAKIDSYNGETITTPYMSTTGELTEGATVIYQLVEPTETELSAAEISAFREMQTFDGVTNITNDSGADMDVKFCANKMLSKCVMPILSGLQKQIDELKAAVLSLGGNV